MVLTTIASMRKYHNSTKKSPIYGTPSEIDNYAKYLGQFYRIGLSKAARLKEIKETKAMIQARQKAKAVLLEGDPDPYKYRVVFKLDEEIAFLKTLLPKRGHPQDDPLALYVTDLANFVKAKEFPELLEKDAGERELRLWAYKIAKRFWQRESKEPKGPTEITFNFAPLPQSPPQRPPQLQPPPQNVINSAENELRKTLH
jgi:hypothetical protein